MIMKKKKEPKRTQRSGIRYALKIGFLSFILFVLITMIILGCLFYKRYGAELTVMRQEIKEAVANSTPDTFRQTETSLVYDYKGKMISTLKGEKDVYYVPYNQLPDFSKKAMISIEDKSFLKHKGVDPKGILRAVVSLVRHGGDIKQGASTITQQLARNIFLSNEVSWERKIKEMIFALELEKKYTKEEILEYYLNNVYFASGYYGIDAASRGYFSKSVKKLNLAEIAFLCAIPNNPTLYNPLRHMENTIKRKDRILRQMKKDGEISALEYQEAKQTEIVLKPAKKKQNSSVETYVYYCATRALMQARGFVFRQYFDSEAQKEIYEKEYENLYDECQQSLYHSGYRIYTSIDMTLQKKLQNVLDEQLKAYQEKNKNGIYLLQGAATCIDNETGKVAAIVGGRSQKLEGYGLNRAYQSWRQPGSAIKPLIVYTPAFEAGYTPDDIVIDQKSKDGPRNAGNRYLGKITLRKAVELSKNTIAWKLFEKVTPSVGLNYLKKMNFARIDANDYFPAASLGGFTKGVNTVEMASGFAAIENDGKYRDPSCIVKILDTKGRKCFVADEKESTIYQKNAARTMTDVLTGVLKNGTGRGLGLSNMSCAGKTGTTNDKKDGWFVGYTPYYTTSVWVGCDMPKTIEALTGSSYPGKIWSQFMKEIHADLKNKKFPSYQKKKSTKSEEDQKKESNDEPSMDDQNLEKPDKTEETKKPTKPDTTVDQPEKDETSEGEVEGEIPSIDGEEPPIE